MERTNLYSNRRDESALANVIAAAMVGLYMTNVSSGLGRYWGISTSAISMVSKILILAALMRCLFIFIARVNWTILLSVFLLALVTMIQQVFFPMNRQYLYGMGRGFTNSTFFAFFVTVLPVIFTVSVITDFDILLKRLQSAALFLSVFTALVLAVYGGEAFERYAMGFGNAMIFPTALVIGKAMDSRDNIWKRWAIIGTGIVDVFAVAMYGSRGSFVAVAGYMVYILLWDQIKQKRLSAILAAAGLLLLSAYYKVVLKTINGWAQRLGFYSRTLNSFSSEKIGDSGRTEIYEKIVGLLKEHPFAVRGINADYNAVGGYCHNWFLELLYAFGILFGGILCVAIAVMIVKVLLKSGQSSKDKIQICLTFAFFPVCLVSGSIWLSTWFWCWVTMYFAAER